MKTLATLLAVISLFILASCKPDSGIQTMTQNSETRSQMMQNIAEDDEMMIEFIGTIRSNKHAMQLMREDHNVMNMKTQGGAMQMTNSNLMEGMMQSILKDEKKMNQMLQMMHKEGFLSDDCMKHIIKMMNNKELNINKMDNYNNNKD